MLLVYFYNLFGANGKYSPKNCLTWLIDIFTTFSCIGKDLDLQYLLSNNLNHHSRLALLSTWLENLNAKWKSTPSHQVAPASHSVRLHSPSEAPGKNLAGTAWPTNADYCTSRFWQDDSSGILPK